MRVGLCATLLSLASVCNPSHAALLYTFHYDAVDIYAAASITFSRASFAQNVGDALDYVSGDLNGCAPARIELTAFDGFGTPIFGQGACGDGTGPAVDGLYFRPDVMPPVSRGLFVSSFLAGRQFELSNGGQYIFTSGSLQISGDLPDTPPPTVPEPGTWALLSLGIAMAWRDCIARRHQGSKQS